MRPLVSVITPTYNRPKQLIECAKRVRQQTYENLEHIIVYDGYDPDLLFLHNIYSKDERYVPILPHALSKNWSSKLYNSFGIAPLLVGMLQAHGDYQVWLSDDDNMDKDYIETLVNLIESENVDFVYTQCWFYWYDQVISEGYKIGVSPPEHGQITNFLYKAELLNRPDCMPKFGTHPVDWTLVKQWLDAGATYKMLNEVKFYHRADQR